MPFDRTTAAPRRIAVIGGGIAGMAAADALADAHRVTLIEAAPRLGGHARTIVAGKRGDQPVDTGFIVYNEPNYPNLTALFDRLGVPTAPSDMSFGASFDGGRFEYGLAGLGALFAQRRNAADPRFLRMIRDILRFNARAEAMAREDETIGDLLGRLGTGAWFRDRYLMPISGAIWSTPAQSVSDFPAAALMRFFRNHALLGVTGQHQWRTVRGGSVEYERRRGADLARRGTAIRTRAPVAAVTRGPGGPSVRCEGGEAEPFDAVVLAAHSDDALAMLADPAPEERAALAAIRYQPNAAVLHADPSVMPRRRAAWSSWSYRAPEPGDADGVQLSYWMNSLQPIPMDDPLFVTLNPTGRIDPALIHDETTFRHPVYDMGALAAQKAVAGFNGARDTWFCGAWMRNGFHEDGFASAVDVARAILDPQPS